MYFTGIGSRNTPKDVLSTMQSISEQLCSSGMVLRSGGADGADTAFERGCDAVSGKKEIYLPWKGFNDNDSELFNVCGQALIIAGDIYGSRWNTQSLAVKKLMARNIYQIIGQELTYDTRSEFVICYTPDGCETDGSRSRKSGGSGQAISLANIMGIPVFNLKNKNAINRINNEIEIINLFSE